MKPLQHFRQNKYYIGFGGELVNVPSSFRLEKGLILTFIECFASHWILPFTKYLQAFCKTALQITRFSLHKSFNMVSFPFLSLSQSSPPQFWVFSRVWPQSPDPGMEFFCSGKTPVSGNCSRNMAMGQQSPRRNMKFIFQLKLWFMRNSWTDYARFNLNRFEGHNDLVELYMPTHLWDLYLAYVSVRLLSLLSLCLGLHVITMHFQHFTYTNGGFC